ncbi:MAG: porin [Methylotenera sp.]|nr:porin [Methylotenera sp.]
MKTKLNLAVASALLAVASSANAGILIPAGDWTVDISGNVNTYYNYTSCDDNAGPAITGGLACNIAPGNGSDDSISSVRTGLLPAFLRVSGKTRQNDLDIGFTVSFQPGTASGGALRTTDQENRQTFLTFGDKSWGTIKLGRDISLYGSDALFNDITILGTGSSFAGANYRAGAAQGGGTGGVFGNPTSGTSLGRIGIGYLYPEWVAQVAYLSPNWNGFSFGASVVEPFQNITGAGGAQFDYSQPGFQGKASYEWAGDVGGKVWSSFWTQKVDGVATATNGIQDYRATIFDIGTKLTLGDFELVATYYDGDGAGTTGFLLFGSDANGNERDSDGGYVQLGYKIPGIGTKIVASYGESNLDDNAVDRGTNLIEKNSSWVLGAYHPLTKSLNLVAEYTSTRSEAQNSNPLTGGARDVDEDNISLGAILFF